MNKSTDYVALLADYQAELCGALHWLRGKPVDGPIPQYIFYLAAQVARWIDGFTCLRANGKIDASRLMVRPSIESILRVQAVRMKPEIFYQIAFSEFEEDRKLVDSAPPAIKVEALLVIARHWEEFRTKYRAKYSDHTLVERSLSTRAFAEAGGRLDLYDNDYRFYCRFTHAAFRAAVGSLDDTQPEDAHVMCLCALVCLAALVSFGASAPNLESLNQRLAAANEKRA